MLSTGFRFNPCRPPQVNAVRIIQLKVDRFWTEARWASYRLKLLDNDRLGEAIAGPFSERRQPLHRLHVPPYRRRHLDGVGAEAVHHWRIHRVRSAERAEQERATVAR